MQKQYKFDNISYKIWHCSCVNIYSWEAYHYLPKTCFKACYHTPRLPLKFTMAIKKSMLTYAKEVLHKVSFDLTLFEKELRKAIRLLVKEELLDLRHWCSANFLTWRYRLVIERCFRFAV